MAVAAPDCRVVPMSIRKYALRRAAAHLGFPAEGGGAMPKQPFITPLTVWLQVIDLYYERIKEAFTSPAAHEFFNVDYLMKMLDDHRSADFSTQEAVPSQDDARIWNVYCFLCWYEVFFRRRRSSTPEDASGVTGFLRASMLARDGGFVGVGTQIALRP